jgi:hypothetical protein
VIERDREVGEQLALPDPERAGPAMQDVAGARARAHHQHVGVTAADEVQAT